MQRIFRLLLVASAIVIGAIWFVHWSKTRALNSGDVHVRETPEDKTPKPDTTETATATQPTEPQDLAANSAGTPGQDQPHLQPDGVATVPTSQPLTRTTQDGVVNVAGGKYQLYRQGDITFRLNTETGQACVLLATEAQWSKTLVYEHGCDGH